VVFRRVVFAGLKNLLFAKIWAILIVEEQGRQEKQKQQQKGSCTEVAVERQSGVLDMIRGNGPKTSPND
jgi:hypothetical protein